MADTTLLQTISAFRTSQVAEHQGLMSKLTIDGQLYDIKDPAVEAMAEAVESRLATLEAKTIRETALNKDNNSPKFATSVTQGTDGQITVTYSDAETTDIIRTATTASEDVLYTAEDAEVIAGTKQVGDVKTPGKIALSGVTAEATLIELAQAIKKEITDRTTGDANLLGTNVDDKTDLTIYGTRAYAKDLVDSLAGENWADNAKKVQEIIEELENSDNANAWATAIDKLAGLGITYSQEEVNAHNATLTGAISTETSLTAEQAAALNAIDGISGYEEGNQPTAEHANAYNATLENAWSTSTVKTPRTVKQYVDDAIAAVDTTNQITNTINTLDATVSANITTSGNEDSVTTSHHVGVKVIEENGILTGITVLEDDIASAQDLDDLTDIVEEHSNVTAAALNDLNTKVNTIDLTKANKAAITTATLNNWTSSYTSGTETVSWTNTPTTVYVPVNGQNL